MRVTIIDGQSVLREEEEREETAKKFGLFRIIIYYGNIKDIEHDLAWKKGRKRCVGFSLPF